MTTTNAQARRQLDQRFLSLRPVVRETRPRRGWVRAIRDALGMSTTELAARLHVSQSTVVDIEQSEMSETIKVETLRRVAAALDCDLFYALVPRTALDEAVRAQARRKASLHLRTIAHHGRLEDQAVPDEATAAQLDELATRLIDKRGLWAESE
jgi:predicted DNA-binding mobile mystery protein A